MKQIVEEAARTHWSESTYNKDAELAYDERDCIVIKALVKSVALRAFKTGADWQAKQSPWISVEERLPKEGQKVFVLVMCYGTSCIREEKFCRNSNLDKKGMWIHGNSVVLAWFPIPSFDEILEIINGRLITKIENMTFSEAVEAMKQGYTVFRDEHFWRMYRPRGVRMNRNGKVVSRANGVSYFSYDDITATDWKIYREHENS